MEIASLRDPFIAGLFEVTGIYYLGKIKNEIPLVFLCDIYYFVHHSYDFSLSRDRLLCLI